MLQPSEKMSLAWGTEFKTAQNGKHHRWVCQRNLLTHGVHALTISPCPITDYFKPLPAQTKAPRGNKNQRISTWEWEAFWEHKNERVWTEETSQRERISGHGDDRKEQWNENKCRRWKQVEKASASRPDRVAAGCFLHHILESVGLTHVRVP